MRLALTHRFAIFLIAACAIHTWASGQNDSTKSPSTGAVAACPAAKLLKAVQIHGQWRVSFQSAPTGLPATATVMLERHAQFGDSVAGFVSRNLAAPAPGHAARAQLAGDLEDGFLTLDESSNGVSITGIWNAEVVDGSCGRSVRGTWKDTSNHAPPDAPEIAFTMERLAGW